MFTPPTARSRGFFRSCTSSEITLTRVALLDDVGRKRFAPATEIAVSCIWGTLIVTCEVLDRLISSAKHGSGSGNDKMVSVLSRLSIWFGPCTGVHLERLLQASPE
jgi:hypothetical protein